MNDMQKGVIMLIKSAITQETQPLPESFSIDEADGFIMKHKVMMLAYDGAVRCGIPKENPTMQKLFQSYIQGMLRSEKQMKAVNELYSAFEENGMDYLPLKGCNMKYLYPKPELRLMGDADILVRKQDAEKAEKIVKELGYKREGEISYHSEWISPNLNLELHTALMPKAFERFYSYFGDGWKKALKLENGKHGYSEEDDFIFEFAHFTKHYIESGIGLRHAADLYVFLEKHKDMNFGYIENELEKLGLRKFYLNVRKVLEYWFENGTENDEVNTISEYIFANGNWGNIRSFSINAEARSTKNSEIKFSKIKRTAKIIFPTAMEMENKYKVLRKMPVLLPFFWVVRWVDVLLHRRKNILPKTKSALKLSDKEVAQRREEFAKAGIEL